MEQAPRVYLLNTPAKNRKFYNGVYRRGAEL